MPPPPTPTRLRHIWRGAGTLRKNIDGSLLTVTYDNTRDVITVEDRRLGYRYPASVGARPARLGRWTKFTTGAIRKGGGGDGAGGMQQGAAKGG